MLQAHEGVLGIGRLVVSLFRPCKTLYTGETGRRLGDRLREHLRDVEKDDNNASKSHLNRDTLIKLSKPEKHNFRENPPGF